jgi:hypothetical protein
MAITRRTEKILWGKAGATCSFPNCRRELIEHETELDDQCVLGQVAHIVARSRDGPRGEFPPPGEHLDSYENLILLCEEHHEIIDAQPNTYTVAKLVQMKKDHEYWVREQLSVEKRFQHTYGPPKEFIKEQVYSTLLPVKRIPLYVYQAPCSLNPTEIKQEIITPKDPRIMLPFILRGGNLITFYNLKQENNPFNTIINPKDVERQHSPVWWEDPDLYRWYVTLLNNSLNKLTGRRRLNLDKEHSRYYFEPAPHGNNRYITYRSLSRRRTTRRVAWQPKFRHSGDLKNYWEHLAVSLRFHLVSRTGWCLSVRPERRFTRDGYTPLTPKGIGRRSTSRKSHMYNIDVLKEVNFWRDYLSYGSPRILFRFGQQSIIVENEMMNTEISWPGVPEDSKPLKKMYYDDSLFTYAEYQEVLRSEMEGIEEWVEDDTIVDGEAYEPA